MKDKTINPQKAPLWLLSLVVVMPTFFAFLATISSNSALMHIAGSFRSTLDYAKCVVTSYIIVN